MFLYAILGIALVVAAAIWSKLAAVFRMFRVALPTTNQVNLGAVPTVSLCIPARNETHAMTACLEQALLSTYPKLEIIVLDDGSRDGTGSLIKAFAHSGIRFVEGSPLPDGWLGKNHALRGLLRESSGEYILFADVDTHLAAGSIDRMVAYMVDKHADMVSVLPSRENTMRASAVFATFRHFWSIVGHTNKNPAVASSAWMIKRDVIQAEFAAFETVKQAVRPEKVIADTLAQRHAYRFVISDSSLGVQYEKKLSSQYETSIRIYYPDFGIGGVLARVLGLGIMLLPYCIVIFGLVSHHIALAAAAFGATLVISILNAWYLGVLRSNNYGIASICLPFLMAREIALLILSVVMYKTGRVTWKGRPVAIR